jgi:hypothetical protein
VGGGVYLSSHLFKKKKSEMLSEIYSKKQKGPEVWLKWSSAWALNSNPSTEKKKKKLWKGARSIVH